jgi:DNA invertase Pin-like site-specific DNA recombinase
LPSDLPAAIKHLSDQELEQLQAAIMVEQQRRGKKPSMPKKTLNKRLETPGVALTISKLNAVRAAFKAGVRPSMIARQFGISQSAVREVLANKKKLTT